jgi:NADH-quinone oxidoreductase subunit I
MAKPVDKPKMNASELSYVPEIARGVGFLMGRWLKNTVLPREQEQLLGVKLPDGEVGTEEQLKRAVKNSVIPDAKTDLFTIEYPEERLTYKQRYRGVHRLTQREDGSPRCVACMCCSTVCPAQCIHIEAGEYGPEDKRAGYERYPEVFIIDEMRCIFCGLCVEACPLDAIRMDTGMHMPGSTLREHFIYDKQTLLSLPGSDGSYKTANPRQDPGDPGYPGIDREKGH